MVPKQIRVALGEYWFCIGFGTDLVLVSGGGRRRRGGGGASCSGSNSCSRR